MKLKHAIQCRRGGWVSMNESGEFFDLTFAAANPKFVHKQLRVQDPPAEPPVAISPHTDVLSLALLHRTNNYCSACGQHVTAATWASAKCVEYEYGLPTLAALPMPAPETPGGPASAIHGLIEQHNGAVSKLNYLGAFNFRVLRSSFDFSVFRYVKIDLDGNMRENVAALSEFIRAEGYAMFNDRTCAQMIDVMQTFFSSVIAKVDKLIAAKETLTVVKARYDKLNSSAPFRMSDQLICDFSNDL